jgi:hypothetical protein
MTWTTWSSVGTSSSWLKSRILSILGRLFEIVSRGGVKGTVRLGQTRRFRWRTFPDDPDVFSSYLQQRYSCFKSTKSGKHPRHPERRPFVSLSLRVRAKCRLLLTSEQRPPSESLWLVRRLVPCLLGCSCFCVQLLERKRETGSGCCRWANVTSKLGNLRDCMYTM